MNALNLLNPHVNFICILKMNHTMIKLKFSTNYFNERRQFQPARHWSREQRLCRISNSFELNLLSIFIGWLGPIHKHMLYSTFIQSRHLTASMQPYCLRFFPLSIPLSCISSLALDFIVILCCVCRFQVFFNFFVRSPNRDGNTHVKVAMQFQ